VTLTVSDGAASEGHTLLLAVNAAGTSTPNPLTVKKMSIAMKFTAWSGTRSRSAACRRWQLTLRRWARLNAVFVGGVTPFTLDSKGKAANQRRLQSAA
jgi:hypothetical protein